MKQLWKGNCSYVFKWRDKVYDRKESLFDATNSSKGMKCDNKTTTLNGFVRKGNVKCVRNTNRL